MKEKMVLVKSTDFGKDESSAKVSLSCIGVPHEHRGLGCLSRIGVPHEHRGLGCLSHIGVPHEHRGLGCLSGIGVPHEHKMPGLSESHWCSS